MLEAAALTTYPELSALGRLTRADRLDEIFNFHYTHREKRIWVAQSGEAPIGMVWIQPGRHPVTEEPDYMVLNIAVVPEWRRRGVARALLEAAQAFARAEGTHRLRLFVGAENTAAYALYRELGFVEQTREMLWRF